MKKNVILDHLTKHTLNQFHNNNLNELGFDAYSLSFELKTDRTNISRTLNNLWRSGKLIKIGGRPVYFVPVDILKDKFPDQNFSIFYKNRKEFNISLSGFDVKNESDVLSVINCDYKFNDFKEIINRNLNLFDYPLPITINTSDNADFFSILSDIVVSGKEKQSNNIFYVISDEKTFLEFYIRWTNNGVKIIEQFIIIEYNASWQESSHLHMEQLLNKLNNSPSVFNSEKKIFVFLSNERNNRIVSSFQDVNLIDYYDFNFFDRTMSIFNLLYYFSTKFQNSFELTKDLIIRLISATYAHSKNEIKTLIFKSISKKYTSSLNHHVIIHDDFISLNFDKKIYNSMEILHYRLPDVIIIDFLDYQDLLSYIHDLRKSEFISLIIESYISKFGKLNFMSFLLQLFKSYKTYYSTHFSDFVHYGIDSKTEFISDFSKFVNSISRHESTKDFLSSINFSNSLSTFTSQDKLNFTIILFLKKNEINKHYLSFLKNEKVLFHFFEYQTENERDIYIKQIKEGYDFYTPIIFTDSVTYSFLHRELNLNESIAKISLDLLISLKDILASSNNSELVHHLNLIYLNSIYGPNGSILSNSIEFKYLESELIFLDVNKASPLLIASYSKVCKELKIQKSDYLKTKYIINASLMLERCIRKDPIVLKNLDILLDSTEINKQYVIFSNLLKPITSTFNIEIPPSEIILLLSIFNSSILD